MKRFVVVVLLLLSPMAQAADPAKLTTANYNKIKIGQSLNDVYALLGPEDTSTFESEDFKSLLWRVGRSTQVTVSFRNGKVTQKIQLGL